MGLTEISLPIEELERNSIPHQYEHLIAALTSHLDSFFNLHNDCEYSAFVPSDLSSTYRALAWLQSSNQVLGPHFCEWGSALGGVAMLAARLGFRSCGIEVERDLIDASVTMAEELGLSVDFAWGSFVPDDAHHCIDSAEDLDRLDLSAAPAYDELGYDPDSFDIIFAYPWPSETQLIFDLFDHCAANGAILLSYHGDDGFRVHRRVPE